MRIRRRPQPPSLQPSDPSTSTAPPTPTPQSADQQSLHGGEEEEEEEEEGKVHLHPRHAAADLALKPAAARRLALPSPSPEDNAAGGGVRGGRHGSRQGAADDLRGSLVNGGHGWPEQKANATCNGGGEAEPTAKVDDGPVSNGVAAVKDEKNGGGGGGAKKRRGPAVLMEGSRCSRVNGRGWRCSQPTLVGYSLCEHHLGKGRMRSVAGAGGGRGSAGQLGRTEHLPRTATIAALPKAENDPALRPC